MNRIAKTRQAGLLTAAEQESLHELRLEFGWPVPASFFLDDEEEPAGDEPLFSPEHIEALQPLLGVQRRLVRFSLGKLLLSHHHGDHVAGYETHHEKHGQREEQHRGDDQQYPANSVRTH